MARVSSGKTCVQAIIVITVILLAGLGSPALAQAAEKCPANPQQVAATYNYTLGLQGIGSNYQFTDENALVEQAKAIKGMGSNLLKISLGKGSAEKYKLGKAARRAETVLGYIEASPEIHQALDMDFAYYQAWVHTFTAAKWRDGITMPEAKLFYDEMYALSEWLLTRYSGTGKTFMIGNWEGDWLLHRPGGRDSTPLERAVLGMVAWLNIRQLAIDNAKANVPHENVELYHYVEVNLVKKAMQGKTSIAHSVLPQTNVDLVSYSSYEAIKRSPKPDIDSIRQPLTEIMAYLESQLQPKEGLPFNRRVFIGEYGYHANKAKPLTVKQQFMKSRFVMQVALELDLPFSLIWQLYNNEYSDDGISKEMSMIDEAGQKRALYFLHQQFYAEMSQFIAKTCAEEGAVPDRESFRAKALEVLPRLGFEKMQTLADEAHSASAKGSK